MGNLAIGGSGKTPMVEHLIRELKGEYNIAILSRGYGRKTKGFLWVEPKLSPIETGDEPLQIKTKFQEIAVAVCEDRVVGVQRILATRPEIDLILLDDAFQHRAIKPSLQILLSTYSKPHFRDYLLPAGRLRESRKGENSQRGGGKIKSVNSPYPKSTSTKSERQSWQYHPGVIYYFII